MITRKNNLTLSSSRASTGVYQYFENIMMFMRAPYVKYIYNLVSIDLEEEIILFIFEIYCSTSMCSSYFCSLMWSYAIFFHFIRFQRMHVHRLRNQSSMEIVLMTILRQLETYLIKQIMDSNVMHDRLLLSSYLSYGFSPYYAKKFDK